MRGEIERSPMRAAPGSADVARLSTYANVIGQDHEDSQEAGHLYKRYVPLAKKIARNFKGRGVDDGDLEAAALLGLAQFDLERRVPSDPPGGCLKFSKSVGFLLRSDCREHHRTRERLYQRGSGSQGAPDRRRATLATAPMTKPPMTQPIARPRLQPAIGSGVPSSVLGLAFHCNQSMASQ